MYVLLSVVSLPFLLLVIAFLALETYFVEKENAFSTTVSLAVFAALVIVFTDWQPWHTLALWHVIGYGIAYLALGVLYSFPRWMLYVKDRCKAFDDKYSELKVKWDAAKGTDTSVNWGAGRARFNTFEDMLRETEKMPPMPWDRGMKGKIYLWMAYWPLSALWILAHRPLEWFWDWAYTTVKEQLKQVSYSIFKSHFEGK